MLKILIADANAERAEKLAAAFNRFGCSAACFPIEKNSINRYLKRHNPDAVILVSNFNEKKLLSFINQSKKNRVVVITAVSQEAGVGRLTEVLSDIVVELDELIALREAFINVIEEKVNALKRSSEKRHGYRFGMFFADLEKGVVLYGDKRLELTPTEYQIMLFLIMANGNFVHRREILKQIWGMANLSTRSPAVHIKNLRKKLRQVTKKYDIESVKGKGYRLTRRA